jgi:hypothetical protein
MSNYKIGTATITEPTTYRQSYETASWYTDYLIPPGTYDVVAHIEWTNDGGGFNRLPYYGVWIECRGTVTASLFVNRLFTASSNVVDQGVDEVREVRMPVSLQDTRLTLHDRLFVNGPPSTYGSPAVNMDILEKRG